MLSKKEYIIQDIEFNSDINSIKITEGIKYNKIINATIFFKAVDKDPIQFTDIITADGNISRKFTIKGEN